MSYSITPPKAGQSGPTLSFRDWTTVYTTSSNKIALVTPTIAERENTLNANNPIVRRMIVDSLRYWVEEMHGTWFSA